MTSPGISNCWGQKVELKQGSGQAPEKDPESEGGVRDRGKIRGKSFQKRESMLREETQNQNQAPRCDDRQRAPGT